MGEGGEDRGRREGGREGGREEGRKGGKIKEWDFHEKGRGGVGRE